MVVLHQSWLALFFLIFWARSGNDVIMDSSGIKTLYDVIFFRIKIQTNISSLTQLLVRVLDPFSSRRYSMFSKSSWIVLLLLTLATATLHHNARVTAFTVTKSTVTTTITSRIYAGPATLEPPVKEREVIEKIEKEEKTQSKQDYKRGGWAVRLFNDPMNKREFVALCLSKIVGLSDGQAYQVMMQAHQNGIGIVGRFDQERAELYKTALNDNGLTCDMVPVEDE
jgi:ATP-dependent Clp protease adapter protein ClpS